MGKKKVQEPGKCPKCGSEDLGYGCGHEDCNQYYYSWTCPKCKTSGREYYNMTFSNHTIDK